MTKPYCDEAVQLPEMPNFLKRNKETKPMTHTPEKKTRSKTILPTVLSGQVTPIAEMEIPELIEHRKRIDGILENVPRYELERRAIRKAIIAKA